MSGLFSIGANWAQGMMSSVGRGSRSRSAAGGLNLRTGSAGSVAADSIRDRFRGASDALRAAFSSFTSRTKPVYTTSLSYTGAAARTSGVAARVIAIDDPYSTLTATLAVNTQGTTVRSSSSAIGLDTTAAASTIQSTGEITPATTSYGSSTLNFAGPGQASTSTATLSGTYTGVNTAAAATSLTVEVTNGATLNPLLGTNINFEVRDQAGTVLFSYGGSLRSGESVSLGADIGLSISFSTGTVQSNHTASTTVTHTNNSVDGTAVFNNANPALRPQFNGGAQVTAGSFSVNGTSITVNADDSINAVITRINASAAGVTATLNNDRITLASNTSSEDDIVLAGDTSGFLSATRLSGATTARGNVRDDQQALSDVAELSGVTNGSFSVNGVSISVDASQDTVASIVSRVNSAGAGVTASYDSATDRLVFTPDVAGAALALEGDTSGFLAAANVAGGTTGTRVNADGAFNAAGVSGPQFDPGLSVQAGSFSVNGVAIAVAADDTLNTVLAKITASAAGVTATYDAATEKVTLASNSGTDPIALTGDTSGFLAAVKLDGTAQAAVAPRTLSAFGTALGSIAEYSTVQAGTLTVNGNQIAIDPATTTARSLVSALNATADVTATLDETTGAITISAREMGGTMTVADTSGVLAALGINAGSYTGAVAATTVVETQTGTVAVTNSKEVAAKAAAAIKELNAAVKAVGADAAGSPAFGADVQAALQGALDSLSAAGMKGLSLTGQGGDSQVTVDADALAASLNRFANEAELDSAVQRVLGRFTEQLAESAATRASEPAAGDQARQLLTVEHTQAALFSLAPIRPRTPDAAARIRSATPDLRRAEWKRADHADIEERRPGPLSRTDPLRSMLDLFGERAPATGRSSWWRW